MSYRYVIIDETHEWRSLPGAIGAFATEQLRNRLGAEWWVGQCVIRSEHLGPALPDPVAVAQDRLRAALWAAPWPAVSTSVTTDPP